jgi:phosphohistidine phosphatase SixA
VATNLVAAEDAVAASNGKREVLRVPVRVSGYQGGSYERKTDGGIGPVIPGVQISFVSEDGSITRNVTTDRAGRYRIDLARGRYIVSASHAGFENYSTAPGFFVVTGNGYQTGNIFLRRKLFTTILLTRHAEKFNNQDQLSAAGQARAQELVHVAQKAGVTTIFATSTNRSQQTVQPLSTHLNLTPVIYNANDYNGLRDMVFQHAGEVVFVAGHSDTMQPIIEAFGGDPQKLQFTGDEYDNLCVITVHGTGADKKTNVVNLQYGQSSP